MTGWVYLAPWGIRAVALVGVILVAVGAARAATERKHAALRRQAIPLTLRAAALGLVLLVALDPTVLVAQKVAGKPSLAVLVDTSYSMSVEDVDGDSRLSSALQVLKDDRTSASLEEDFRLDLRAFDRSLRPTALADLDGSDARGEASDLGAALGEAVSAQTDRESQAGVLVVSDGRATSPGPLDAARLALARSVPVWTWCLGGEVPLRDLWIEAPSREVLAFATSEVDLHAFLHHTGYPNRSFKVEILRKGEVIEVQEVLPDESGRARIKTTITAPESGEERITFRVLPDAGEADERNNERAVFVRVVGDKVRVLLAEGRPHWDTKFLVQMMKQSEYVDLTAVYRLGKDRVFAVVSSKGDERREEKDLFPRTAEEMMQFDIIVFGRGCETFFGEGTDQQLTEFVSRRGGGLIFARGNPYEGYFRSLAKFEPVTWDEGLQLKTALRPTAAGRESPIFELGVSDDLDDVLERLPSPDLMRSTSGEKPLAVVLATSDESGRGRTIAIAYQRYGQGKVLQLNASGLWRWAFRERGKDEDEHVYAQFWSAILRWMLSGADFMPGVTVSLRSERRYYTDEQKMRFIILTRGIDEATYRPQLSVTGASESVQIEPRPAGGGSFAATAGPFPPGSYTVKLVSNVGKPAEQSITIEVVSSSVEKRVLSANPDLMKQIATVSGGGELQPTDVADMKGVVERWRAQRQTSIDRRTVWDRWYVMAALVALLGVEWFLRRREGLL